MALYCEAKIYVGKDLHPRNSGAGKRILRSLQLETLKFGWALHCMMCNHTHPNLVLCMSNNLNGIYSKQVHPATHYARVCICMHHSQTLYCTQPGTPCINCTRCRSNTVESTKHNFFPHTFVHNLTSINIAFMSLIFYELQPTIHTLYILPH